MNGEAFDRVLAVNLGGVYNTVITALPQIAARRGHIVVTSSVYAFLNGLGAAPYAMAKAGVEQLGRALRVELVPHGAGASVAYFGFIDTEMVHRAIDADPIADQMQNALPTVLRKRLSPAQAGEAVARGIEKRAPRIIAPQALGGVQRAARDRQPAARRLHAQGRRHAGDRPRARLARRSGAAAHRVTPHSGIDAGMMSVRFGCPSL